MGKTIRSILLILCVILVNVKAHAGGPLVTVRGEAVVYSSSVFPVPYHPDRGTLGTYSSSKATELVEACFQAWQDVPTASITFENDGQLPVDVNSFNYYNYFEDYSDGLNPIIFDSDGSIIDAEFGSGASNTVIGFAGSSYYTSGHSVGYYAEGLAVLNGRFSDGEASPADFTYNQFKATFVHEFGHFFGLDHCQINARYVADGSTANDPYIPTMYPTSTDDDTSLGDLNPDDRAVITLLYPEGNVDKYYGKLRGTVTRGNGQAVKGANVVAVKIGDEDMGRFSSISDYYMQNDGAYEMLVTAGTYKLFMEPVSAEFTGGSSVGPYAENASDYSFIDPVTEEYYNGDDESSNETDLNAYEEVTVSAGETITGIDFVAEGGDYPLDTTTTTTTGVTTTTVTGTTTTTSIPAADITVVDFEGRPLYGPVPLKVEFKNRSTGNISSYEWNFGDGGTSTDKDPVHDYIHPGTYRVILIAYDAEGNSVTELRQDYITVTNRCLFVTILDNYEHVLVLRTLRDRERDNFFGKLLTDIYYANSAEVSAILLQHSDLQDSLRDLVEENIGIAQEVVYTGKAEIPESNLHKIIEFLDEIKKHASLKLKFYINLVIKGMEYNILLKGTGFTL
jgi:PKD repeat protein